MNGRRREVRRIRQANRAAAVGRLLLGDIRDWQEFLEADTIDLEALPRRRLKSSHHDVRRRLSKEIDDFCTANFENITAPKLSELYEAVKSRRGLEMPLDQFEEEFATVRPRVLKGHPSHSTMVISLWSMQFEYPEQHLADDVKESLIKARSCNEQLRSYANLAHVTQKGDRDSISSLLKWCQFSSRACLLSCFNLLEAYFNGLAWLFSKDTDRINKLSRKKQDLIKDTGRTRFRDKILKYPEIISGKHLWDESVDPVKTFLDEIKPFRDAVVHPSPFTTPEKFGGRDKLQALYRLNLKVVERCVELTCQIITRVEEHLNGAVGPKPLWLTDFTNRSS